MSRQLINEYRSELDRLRSVTGSSRETNLRPAFARLLRAWGRQALDLVFVEEHQVRTAQGNLISIDGALLHALRVPFGYWEAKDRDDKLDDEIAAKFRKGYPRDNIIFSDDHTAVLYQDGAERLRVAMGDTDALYPLLTKFFAHERQEIADFNKAVKQFASDLPDILDALRDRIAEKHAASDGFAAAVAAFLDHARDAINPAVNDEDVREMLIQHILTEDIFAKVFDDPDFHRKNNVAAELYKLEENLFDDRGEKQSLLKALGPYYSGIASTAALISSHSEKQGFLKALYEDFYKAYNRKAADRLGVVYTPGEIVRFMIRAADWLCEKHFGKNLVDAGVEILDPATGTGTFIVELLEHFRGDHEKLRRKYKEELHANEIAILPYYVANLNIEATYQAITGQFAEFENLCLVDTLDNVDSLKAVKGLTHMGDLYGGISTENMARIKRQNERNISVIIGNPPYNANQQSENDNNKNRTYRFIDANIKATYIKASTAQKTKLYDMYARFYRWATDRLGDDGIIAFVTNRSFLESRTFDGFRKILAQDFNEIWVVDLGGDVRANPKLSGTKHNVFGIQTGVAICMLMRRRGSDSSIIRYIRRPEDETAVEKLSWLDRSDLSELPAATIRQSPKQDWLHIADDTEWDTLVPLADSNTKQSNSTTSDIAIFKLYSLGVITQRDEWVYGKLSELKEKLKFFISHYEFERLRWLASDKTVPIDKFVNRSIKWNEELEGYLVKNKEIAFDQSLIVKAFYRPFAERCYYYDTKLTHSTGQMPSMFPLHQAGAGNLAITTMGDSSGKPFFSLATNRIVDLNFVSPASGGSRCYSRYRYTKAGERIDNVTDWALNKFVAKYGQKGVTKDAIFHYVYAVLHDPIYRERFALNLKREFPRIPLYADFAKWAAWGATLMEMHIGYEEFAPFPLVRVDTPALRRAPGTNPKPKLKCDPGNGLIIVDEDTQLSGIPPEAWAYRLGNRSAIDWVLDQHKEKTPRDPTVREKFNTYRFADYKESMIELLAKVVTVSLNTMQITEAMRGFPRGEDAALEVG